MNQRKFETRGRPRRTTAPPPRRGASASGLALSIGFDRHGFRARLKPAAHGEEFAPGRFEGSCLRHGDEDVWIVAVADSY